jgi:hypothetical protein
MKAGKLQRIIFNILEDRGCTGGVESCRDAATMHGDGDSLNFNALQLNARGWLINALRP